MVTILQTYCENDETLIDGIDTSYSLYELYEYLVLQPDIPIERIDKRINYLFYNLPDKTVVRNFLEVDFLNDMFEMGYMLDAIQRNSSALQSLHKELENYIKFKNEGDIYMVIEEEPVELFN